MSTAKDTRNRERDQTNVGAKENNDYLKKRAIVTGMHTFKREHVRQNSEVDQSK